MSNTGKALQGGEWVVIKEGVEGQGAGREWGHNTSKVEDYWPTQTKEAHSEPACIQTAPPCATKLFGLKSYQLYERVHIGLYTSGLRHCISPGNIELSLKSKISSIGTNLKLQLTRMPQFFLLTLADIVLALDVVNDAVFPHVPYFLLRRYLL